MEDRTGSDKKPNPKQEPIKRPLGEDEQPEEDATHAEPNAAFVWREFLLSKGVQDFVSSLTALIQSNIKTKAGTTRLATISLLFWTAVLAGIVIGPATWLAWEGKISSDAATFLFGTVIGAAFTFLRGFFSSKSG